MFDFIGDGAGVGKGRTVAGKILILLISKKKNELE